MDNKIYMILGGGGCIGDAICNRLAETVGEQKVFAFGSDLDISDSTMVKEFMDYLEPSVVINCAAKSDLVTCQKSRAAAYTSNSVGPKYLAELCDERKVKFVHFSAYTVFDGKKSIPYTERCKQNPISENGKSRLAGERAIKIANKNHIIIRTGLLVSSHHKNFLSLWLNNMDKKLGIKVPSDTMYSFVFAYDLAQAVVDLMRVDANGTFHVANNNGATLKMLADSLALHTQSNMALVSELSQKDIPLHDPLANMVPKYNILSTKKLTKTTGREMRPWEVALKQCLIQMQRFRP